MIFFPFKKVRKFQDEFLKDVSSVIRSGSCLLAHAPTGLGKTSAVLVPLLDFAIKNDKTIFFLTPRHTQHKLIIDTLRLIKSKSSYDFCVVDLIGKKWMCAIPGVSELGSHDFGELCRELRLNNKCKFYNNVYVKSGVSVSAQDLIDKISKSPMHVEEVIDECVLNDFCPYEVTVQTAKRAKIIIADYYHLFNDFIRSSLLLKIEKGLRDAIIVCDEAHNLPDRMRELLSAKISNLSIGRAMKECKEFDKELFKWLSEFLNVVVKYGESVENEKLLKREWLLDVLERITGVELEDVATRLDKIAERVREGKKKVYCSSIANFLRNWLTDREEFVRLFTRERFRGKDYFVISNNCLDPSLATKPVLDAAYSSIVMSGTLLPLKMYADLLGVKNGVLKQYKSPFPRKNRLILVVPKTTTKYSKRSLDMFKHISDECLRLLNSNPVNCAVFFPSYALRDRVYDYLKFDCERSIFLERRGMLKKEKIDFIQKFKEYSKKNGAVLLGAVSGNFSEGFDFPGEFLQMIIIVGIPLNTPNLFTKALINFYDNKFGKGWQYGYTFPAMNRVLQAAGRAIRSKTDKGVIVLLDERYVWSNYFSSLPDDIIVTKHPEKYIQNFFSE